MRVLYQKPAASWQNFCNNIFAIPKLASLKAFPFVAHLRRFLDSFLLGLWRVNLGKPDLVSTTSCVNQLPLLPYWEIYHGRLASLPRLNSQSTVVDFSSPPPLKSYLYSANGVGPSQLTSATGSVPSLTSIRPFIESSRRNIENSSPMPKV